MNLRGERMSLERAELHVERLPVAEEQEVRRVITEQGLEAEVENWKAIYNVTDEQTAAVVTKKYQLVQHAEFFKPALKAVKALGIQVEYVRVMDSRERVDMELIPESTENMRGQEIALGLRLSNSIDGSIAARVQAYGLRVICINGMIGRTLFGGKSMIHVGRNVNVEGLADDIEEILPMAVNNLNTIIREGMDTEVIHAETVLEEAGFGGDYQDEITEEFAGNTRWELYCEATRIVDHDHEDVKESTREDLHRKANAILTGV